MLKAIEEVESGLAAYNRDGRNIAAQQRLVNTSKRPPICRGRAMRSARAPSSTSSILNAPI